MANSQPPLPLDTEADTGAKVSAGVGEGAGAGVGEGRGGVGGEGGTKREAALELEVVETGSCAPTGCTWVLW